MPTFAGTVVNNQILITSEVSIPGQNSFQGYSALLDTGAQVTLISPRIVSKIGLLSIGNGSITPANGQPIITPRYRVSVMIPVTEGSQTISKGRDIDVLQLPYQPPNYDILLGMDFIYAFHLTLIQGNFVLSI